MSPLHVLGQKPGERCPGCGQLLASGEPLFRVRGIAFTRVRHPPQHRGHGHQPPPVQRLGPIVGVVMTGVKTSPPGVRPGNLMSEMLADE